MKKIRGLALAACLAVGCTEYEAPDRPGAAPKTPRPPDWSVDDLRDNAIGTNAAEPPWHDLIRHTSVSGGNRATHPSPSRDGTFFLYATTEFGPHPQIARRETTGVAPTQLTQNNGDNFYPRISPDGGRFAYASNKDGNFDIFVARIDSPLSVTQVTFEEGDDIAPAWSPDGKRLVYSRNIGGIWQLVIVDVGTRVKTFLGPGMYPDWSPNTHDDWIAFQSQPRVSGGRSGVWIVHSDGTGLREVVSDKAHGWSALTPRFSNDGRWITYATANRSPESRAFGSPDEADDVWVIRPDGTYDTRLTDDLSAEWRPAWGKDRIFFVSNRGGGINLWSLRVKPLDDPEEK
jgi:Tol biopolymer transport system component